MLIIRGVNVFPTQIEEQLLSIPELAPHYQIIVNREGNMDEMTINVETKQDGGGSDKALSARTLQQKVKQLIGVSSKVNVLETGGIPRSQGKAQRVIDNRNL